jgi:hypothetical protein
MATTAAALAALVACCCSTTAATAAGLPLPPPPPLLPAGPGPAPPALTLDADPLDLRAALGDGYMDWAALLARVLLAKADGNATAAAGALGRLMLSVHGLLARASSGGEPLFPRFHLTDPVFGRDAGAVGATFHAWLARLDGKKAGRGGGGGGDPLSKLAADAAATPTTVTRLDASSSFFNFAPCVLGETPAGVAAEVTGERAGGRWKSGEREGAAAAAARERASDPSLVSLIPSLSLPSARTPPPHTHIHI